MDHLHDALRPAEIAQAMLAEVDEIYRVLEVVADQVRGRSRGEDLPAVSRGGHTRRAIHRGTEVVAFTQLSATGVQAHPHPQRLGERPILSDERALGVEGGDQRMVGEGECGMEPVASCFHDMAVAVLDGGAKDRVVASERRSHGLGMLLPEPGGALEVGEQERHGSRG